MSGDIHHIIQDMSFVNLNPNDLKVSYFDLADGVNLGDTVNGWFYGEGIANRMKEGDDKRVYMFFKEDDDNVLIEVCIGPSNFISGMNIPREKLIDAVLNGGFVKCQ